MADPATPRTVRVVAVLPSARDRSALRRIFSRCNWSLEFATTLEEAKDLLRDGTTGVVLSDSDFPDQRTWRHLLQELQSRSQSPPLIVTSDLADDRLWAEVLNVGGYDLLMKPFDSQEVIRVVSLAWRGWVDRLRRDAVLVEHSAAAHV